MMAAGAARHAGNGNDGHVLFGDMVIAHSLLEELGERRTTFILAMLENPELELAPSDKAAFSRFLQRLEDHYGRDMPACRQLRVISGDAAECPEP